MSLAIWSISREMEPRIGKEHMVNYKVISEILVFMLTGGFTKGSL